MAQQFKIKGTLYQPVPINRLSMNTGLELEDELRAKGRKLFRWLEIVQVAVDREQGADHATFLSMVAVWAARRAAGEQVTFAEANDYTIDEFEIVGEPDEIEPEGKAPGDSEPAGDPLPA